MSYIYKMHHLVFFLWLYDCFICFDERSDERSPTGGQGVGNPRLISAQISIS